MQLAEQYPSDLEGHRRANDSIAGITPARFDPFCGVVINRGIEVGVHADPDFEQLLGVLVAMGRFRGGGLILPQIKLVVELERGDLSMFYAAHLLHLNEKVVGDRDSVAFSSDVAYDPWMVGLEKEKEEMENAEDSDDED